MANQILERIRRVRADALYGKKKHYNAARRKELYQTRASLTVIIINVILGSALLLYAKEADPGATQWVGGLLAMTAAAVAALQKYFSWPKVAQGHLQVAAEYLDIAKQCSNLLAKHADGVVSQAQLGEQLDKLTAAGTKINQAAHAYSTNRADFRAAQRGIEEGEEDYSEQELRAGD